MTKGLASASLLCLSGMSRDRTYLTLNRLKVCCMVRKVLKSLLKFDISPIGARRAGLVVLSGTGWKPGVRKYWLEASTSVGDDHSNQGRPNAEGTQRSEDEAIS